MGTASSSEREPGLQEILDAYERDKKEIVRLSGKQLVVLPERLTGFTWMTELNLSSNNLDLGKGVLAQLTHLQKLVLGK